MPVGRQTSSRTRSVSGQASRQWMTIGSFGLLRERHLVAKNAILHVARRVIVEIVEANFAPGDDFRVLGELRELVEMLRRDLLRLVRVDADRGVDPVVLIGIFDRGVELFGAGTRADRENVFDARRASAIEHGVAVVSELWEIDVCVRVD